VALKLENEFVVSAPIEPTWRTLLDLERVAGCLPGATIEPSEQPGTYSGSMRMKLGPVSMNYKGTATLESVDEAAHTAVFAVQGKETRGQGSATATIRNQLVDESGATRVRVETELSVTGRPAQFGRGIMQDVAASMLGDFAKCLSELMAADGGDAAAAANGPGDATPLPAEPEAPRATPVAPAVAPKQSKDALKVGGVLGKVLLARLKSLGARLTRRR
jgi:carbon monoxide dehydrogenase subunit G